MPTTATLNILETFHVHCCHTCGVSYALTAAFENRRREDHKHFYCPNGHEQYYPQKTDAEKAQAEAQQQRERAERLAHQVTLVGERLTNERRRHSATKGQLTKTRKRIGNGVCPCCSRHFANVERHIADKHPEFAA